jgi:hypothetical protein
MKKLSVLVAFILPFSLLANDRITTSNNFVWINNFVNVKATERILTTGEYQFRRTNYIENWQQSLLRFTLQYKLPERINIGGGYGWIESFSYGEFGNSSLKPTLEHRLFQQITKDDNAGRVAINHRFRLEQRFVGVNDLNYQDLDKRIIEDWRYTNRFRYQLKTNIPLNNKIIDNKTLYASFYNEIFIGFGKNVRRNVFDQNRTGLLAGYRFNNYFNLEGGYFLMTLQQANQIQNKDVYQ